MHIDHTHYHFANLIFVDGPTIHKICEIHIPKKRTLYGTRVFRTRCHTLRASEGCMSSDLATEATTRSGPIYSIVSQLDEVTMLYYCIDYN